MIYKALLKRKNSSCSLKMTTFKCKIIKFMIMSKPSNPKIKTSANKKQTISTTKKKAPAKKCNT